MTRRRPAAILAPAALAVLAILPALGCRHVQLADRDRSIVATPPGPTASTLRIAPASARPGDAIARPGASLAVSPAADIADRIRDAAPPVCEVRSRPGWTGRGDPFLVAEYARRIQVFQGDSHRAVHVALRRRAADEPAATADDHADGVRFSRWRSRTSSLHPRGIVLRLHGLDEAPIDRRLDRQLLDGGWMIVQFDSIELGSIGFARTPAGRTIRTVRTAAEAGRVVDDIVSQVASAAEHVVMSERAQLIRDGADPDMPVIVAGTSLGGILAPAAAALLEDTLTGSGSRVHALVLLAAGGDLGGISATSSAMQLGASLVPPAEMVNWRRLMREAIRFSRLDPLLVAPSLRHIPTLMLHGRFDEVVPARFGDELWQALGRPDRYSYLAGHYGVLGLLVGESDSVVRWIGRMVHRETDAD